MQPNHRRLLHVVSETPWAILPSKLEAIRELIALRVEGYKFTDEEVRERIGAGPRPQNSPQRRGGLAVIPIAGVIAPKANLMSEVSGGTSLDLFLSSFREALANDSISTILLDVDSPGGATDMVPEAAAAIRKARGSKLIVAMVNNVAASAAYWLAAQAEEIVVTPSGSVGSIGVYGIHEDISAKLAMEGVKSTVISAGKFKTEGNPLEPLTDEARAAIQKTVDQFYGMFVDDVAKGRGVESQAVADGFGQGRMVTAKDALRAGMADRIDTFDATVSRLLGGAPVVRRPVRRAEAAELPIAATTHLTTAASTSWSQAFVESPVVTDRFTSSAATAATSVPQASRATKADSDKQGGSTMFSNEELVARQDEITARQKELDTEYAGQLMPDDVRAEFDGLDQEFDGIEAVIKDVNDRKARLAARVVAAKPEQMERLEVPMTNVGRRTPDNIYALEDYRSRARSMDEMAELYTDGAKRALEVSTFEHPQAKKEDVQGHIEKLLTRDTQKGTIAHRLLATGSPAYDRAFGKLLQNKPLTGTESQALQAATLNTGDDGGYAIPFTLDPTVVPTSNGAVNPWRQISNVKTITGNTWKGVTSDGVSAKYDAELTLADESVPTFLQPEIHVEKAQVFVPFSIEEGEDWAGMRAELASMIQDAKDVSEADQFANGSGTDEPQGIVAGLPNGSKVQTAVDNTFAVDDLYLLDDELPARFEPLAQMVANKAVYNQIRSLTGDQFDIFIRLQQGQDKNAGGNTGTNVLGYPAWRCSEMSSDMLTDSEPFLLLGDFRYFAIVDRVGLNVEVIPHLMDQATGRPLGRRGLYAYYRNSSGILSDNAFRLLIVNPSP